MKSRIIAAAVAVVLGVLGTVVLLAYVRSVEARPAVAAQPTVPVLVATAAIPRGTTGAELAALVHTRQLAADAVLAGGVAAAADLDGKVATVDLQPGEQILAAKFAEPAELANASGVAAAANLQQVTIQLESKRAVGGNLSTGDLVGVFISLDDTTHLTLHKVPVTAVVPVRGGSTENGTGTADAKKPATADPTVEVQVTLAVAAGDAEQIVFAAEYARVWLSKEPATADESGTTIITKGTVLQ
jgi:pilus assembly protein CpaB